MRPRRRSSCLAALPRTCAGMWGSFLLRLPRRQRPVLCLSSARLRPALRDAVQYHRGLRFSVQRLQLVLLCPRGLCGKLWVSPSHRMLAEFACLREWSASHGSASGLLLLFRRSFRILRWLGISAAMSFSMTWQLCSMARSLRGCLLRTVRRSSG